MIDETIEDEATTEVAKGGIAGKMILFTEAQHLKPRRRELHELVRTACKDKTLWMSMWPYLTGTAGTDSREFDHGAAVDRLLQWDAKNGKHIAEFRLSWRKLWQVLSRQLAAANFDMDNGHIAGLRIDNGSDNGNGNGHSNVPPTDATRDPQEGEGA